MSVLTLDSLIQAKKPVYVQNMVEGIIAITVFGQNGRPSRVTLPRTRHPINLSDKITPWELENAREFRDLFAKKALQILDPDFAMQELMKPNVRAELAAAEKRIGYGNEEVAKMRKDINDGNFNQEEIIAKAIGNQVGVKSESILDASNPHADIGNAEPDDSDDEGQEEENTSAINGRVVIVCASLNEGETSPKDAKLELDNMVEHLTIKDLDYVAKSTTGIVKDWASEILATRRGKNVLVD